MVDIGSSPAKPTASSGSSKDVGRTPPTVIAGHKVLKVDDVTPSYHAPISTVLTAAVQTAPGEQDLLYLRHFDRQMRQTLPKLLHNFNSQIVNSLPVRHAVLCLAASNLSVLDAPVHSRYLAGDSRRSVFSPNINRLHDSRARRYHDCAQRHCLTAEKRKRVCDVSAILVAKVLLAFYHHSSTDHLQFRLAVWQTVLFVRRNRRAIIDSPLGDAALQLWYRLCASHRPSKPPALLLEGEGSGCFSPNLALPDENDYLHLKCILGMSTDDLVYDILIKTLEIRTRIIVYRCTSQAYNISECSNELGKLAYKVLNEVTGRPQVPHEEAEAVSGFVRGGHLMKLLEVQEGRLQVWKSMLDPDQLPRGEDSAPPQRHQSPPNDHSHIQHTFSTHRDTVNYLYYMLCNMIFEEMATTTHFPTSHHTGESSPSPPSLERMAQSMVDIIIHGVDMKQSTLHDVYTYSLTELLLQLTYISPVFPPVLDVIWPRLETSGRGFEHSHFPTQLVKRIIAAAADTWTQKNRHVRFSLLALPENTPKRHLFDMDRPFDLAIYGCDREDGSWFIERISLP